MIIVNKEHALGVSTNALGVVPTRCCVGMRKQNLKLEITHTHRTHTLTQDTHTTVCSHCQRNNLYIVYCDNKA